MSGEPSDACVASYEAWHVYCEATKSHGSYPQECTDIRDKYEEAYNAVHPDEDEDKDHYEDEYDSEGEEEDYDSEDEDYILIMKKSNMFAKRALTKLRQSEPESARGYLLHLG